jgi:uncharacterized protein (DUF952 family)
MNTIICNISHCGADDRDSPVVASPDDEGTEAITPRRGYAMICHIARQADWSVAQRVGSYSTDSLAAQGFIHCSDLHQVIGVANGFYRGQSDLLLLVIDPTRLNVEIRYEPGDLRTSERFPHCYGPVNVDAIVTAIPLSPLSDGSFLLPTTLQGGDEPLDKT